MPERIYTSTGDGKLEALEETRFSTEGELQALIAEPPDCSTVSRSVPEMHGAGFSSPARRASLRRRVKPPDGRSIT